MKILSIALVLNLCIIIATNLMSQEEWADGMSLPHVTEDQMNKAREEARQRVDSVLSGNKELRERMEQIKKLGISKENISFQAKEYNASGDVVLLKKLFGGESAGELTAYKLTMIRFRGTVEEIRILESIIKDSKSSSAIGAGLAALSQFREPEMQEEVVGLLLPFVASSPNPGSSDYSEMAGAKSVAIDTLTKLNSPQSLALLRSRIVESGGRDEVLMIVRCLSRNDKKLYASLQADVVVKGILEKFQIPTF